MRTLIAAVLFIAFCTSLAVARTWTDSTGTHTLEAEFVDFKDGKVNLKKEDSKTVAIPIERLSESDQEFVKAQLVPKIGEKSKAKKPAAKAPSGVRGDGAGEFDKEGFDMAMDNATTPKALQHVVKLFPQLGYTNLEAFQLLLGFGRHFIRDNKGVLNRNANKQAFTDAVLNVTPVRLKKALTLSGESDPRAALLAIIHGCGGFVRGPGQFDKVAFNQAFDNVDISKVKMAAGLMNTKPAVALAHIITASSRFANQDGSFDAASFNARFDTLRDKPFSGSEDERISTFLESMEQRPEK